MVQYTVLKMLKSLSKLVLKHRVVVCANKESKIMNFAKSKFGFILVRYSYFGGLDCGYLILLFFTSQGADGCGHCAQGG